MLANHVLCTRTLLRTLQAGNENTKPLIKNLSRLLRKNLGFYMVFYCIFSTWYIYIIEQIPTKFKSSLVNRHLCYVLCLSSHMLIGANFNSKVFMKPESRKMSNLPPAPTSLLIAFLIIQH